LGRLISDNNLSSSFDVQDKRVVPESLVKTGMLPSACTASVKAVEANIETVRFILMHKSDVGHEVSCKAKHSQWSRSTGCSLHGRQLGLGLALAALFCLIISLDPVNMRGERKLASYIDMLAGVHVYE